MIAALGLGLLIGILLGLLGGGGSILAVPVPVPALVYGAGVPLHAAIPISLLVVGISAATALLPRLRSGDIQWRIAAVFGTAGAGAAFAGAAVNRILDPRIVLGGGFLIIPAFVLLLGLPMTSAVATSLVVIVINSAAGFLAHAGDAPLDYRIAVAFTAAAVLGSVAAGRLGRRVPTSRLQRWFAYLVFAVGAFVIVQVILGAH